MSVLPILKWPDQRLSEVCAPVEPGEDLSSLISDMFDTMYAAPGRGLAGPQVGVLKRLFVMDVDWKERDRRPQVMINPEILWRSPESLPGNEGCLSIPGVTTEVSRPARIRLRWQTADGEVQEQDFDGFAARCIQHEYDHLDGRVTFDRLSDQARAIAEATYHSLEDMSE